jgi:hypothetical protein
MIVASRQINWYAPEESEPWRQNNPDTFSLKAHVTFCDTLSKRGKSTDDANIHLPFDSVISTHCLNVWASLTVVRHRSYTYHQPLALAHTFSSSVPLSFSSIFTF